MKALLSQAALLFAIGGMVATAHAQYIATDLNPTSGYASSNALGAGGAQVGSGDVGLINHALLWSGTAASVVDLNPTGTIGSIAYGVDGSHQVGVKLTDGVHPDHALLWSGTAASVVELNPTGYGTSIAWGVSGSSQAGQAIPTG